MLLRRLNIPLDDPDNMASALRQYIGTRLRLTEQVSGDAHIPWANSLAGTGSHRLSGTDFILKDVMPFADQVDLMIDDCGTGKSWRLFFVVPDTEPSKWYFNEVCDHIGDANIRRDDWLREVFS